MEQREFRKNPQGLDGTTERHTKKKAINRGLYFMLVSLKAGLLKFMDMTPTKS